ncbi:MAG: hypothetical protein LBP58_06965 [Azoarcus sp.]|jgi:hypothetical protein|nr:hypothetical protein [Azoarcus sp.]
MKQTYFRTHFAVSGDADPIGFDADPSGVVTFSQGWTFDYQRDQTTDAQAKPIDRATMNWLIGVITAQLKQYQENGFPEFITADDNGGSPFAYQKLAVVQWSASGNAPFDLYISLVDNNIATPADDTKWSLFSEFAGGKSVKYLASGTPLPTTNTGPIWHDDYNDIMTWQTFSNNGANYTGYASRLVGSPLIETQSTPRAGYVKSGAQNLSRTTYAALRGWAMHNGIYISANAWAAGRILVCDNNDGETFRIYDVRGEFPRFWDEGRGVDAGRTFGSWQTDSFKSHMHSVKTASSYNTGAGSNNRFPNSNNIASGTNYTEYTGGTETRSRNTAFLACVKY